MSAADYFQLDDRPPGANAADAAAAGGPVLRLAGAWRMHGLADIEAALAALAAQRGVAPRQVDGSALTELDSAAALVLLRALGDADTPFEGFAPPHARVLERVREHLKNPVAPPLPKRWGALAQLGAKAAGLGALLAGHLNFFGATAAALGEGIRHPSRVRPRELSAQFQQTGLDAIPVVALVTALIGVVFAYLLGLQASQYGANIFVVDGVAIGMTRELGPIIVAVIIAGRSGAAFTAQLGSMRLAEETDAIRTLGLSPMQVLVVPRALALMVALPLLVFVGDAASLAGAMAIAGPMLDITPAAFLARLRESLELRHAMVGLVKAPVFALVIAVIGTRMGLTVARDTRAVGIATTSTVVQSIVAVILLDALFAVVLQELGW